MTHTDHAPLQLHPNQHVWYRSPRGPIMRGTVWNPKPIFGIMHEARYEIRLLRQGKPSQVKVIPAAWIRRGEAERCRQEEVRCMAEAETDEGALLGARDWAKERKVIQGGS